jgi:hypothetical protein
MNSGTIAGLTSAPLKTKGWNNLQKTVTSSGTVSWKSGLGAINQIFGPNDQDLTISSAKPAQVVSSSAGKHFQLKAGSATIGTGPSDAYGGSVYITAGDSVAPFSPAMEGGFVSIKGGKNNDNATGGEIIVWGGAGGTGKYNGNTLFNGISLIGNRPIYVATNDPASGGSQQITIKTGNGGGAGSTGAGGGPIAISTGSGPTFAGLTVGGDTGVLSLTTGNGGRASAGTGGASGAITITTGAGGVGTTVNGGSGSITISTGLAGAGAGSAGTSGSILFNTGSTNQITISPARTTITNEAKIERAAILETSSTSIQLDVTNYAGMVINCTATSAVTITLPTTNVPVGYNVVVIRSGTGTITFVEGTVTVGGAANVIRSYSNFKSIDSYSSASLICLKSGSSGVSAEYSLSGGLIA